MQYTYKQQNRVDFYSLLMHSFVNAFEWLHFIIVEFTVCMPYVNANKCALKETVEAEKG